MRILKAAGALLVLAAIVVVPPWLLTQYVGNPWPAEGVSLSGQLTDGVIIGVLAVLVWVLWAQLMVCVVVEIARAVRMPAYRRGAPAAAAGVPFTLGIQQQLARRLVAAVMLSLTAAPVFVGAANAAPAASPVVAAAPQAAQQAASAAVEEQERAVEVRVMVVQRHDTLWGIAERELGDGTRLTEIARLNEGRDMGDGTVFRAEDNIQPGWELRIPATTPQAGQPGAPSGERQAEDGRQVVVEPGDSLSKIAKTEYGDGNQWPQVYDANRGVVGSDPDLIHPGQVLHIPTGDGQQAAPENPAPGNPPSVPEAPQSEAPVPPAPENPSPAPEQPEQPGQPAQPQGEATPAPEKEPTSPEAEVPPPGHAMPEQDSGQDGGEASQPPAGQNGPTGAAEDAEEDTVEDSGADAGEEGLPVRTTFGIGALLAAAVVSVIAGRRLLQQRRRKPGQRVPLPADPDTRAVEQELRAVADPIAVEHVDVALRDLALGFARDGAPMPNVRLARLAGERLEVYLEEPAALPAPWEPSEIDTMWLYPAAAVDAVELEHAAGMPAPYPGLVTVGHDGEDGHLLVNLERLRMLHITGGQEQARAAAAAAAVELATSAWGEDVVVTAVGSFDEDEEVLRTGRLRYVPTVEAFRPAEDELDVVVVFDEDQTRAGREQLERLVDGGGVAAIVVGEPAAGSRWHLEIRGDQEAELKPLGLQLRPQLLEDGTYRHLLNILAAADQPPTGGGAPRGDRSRLTLAGTSARADSGADGSPAAAAEPGPDAQEPVVAHGGVTSALLSGDLPASSSSTYLYQLDEDGDRTDGDVDTEVDVADGQTEHADDNEPKVDAGDPHVDPEAAEDQAAAEAALAALDALLAADRTEPEKPTTAAAVASPEAHADNDVEMAEPSAPVAVDEDVAELPATAGEPDSLVGGSEPVVDESAPAVDAGEMDQVAGEADQADRTDRAVGVADDRGPHVVGRRAPVVSDATARRARLLDTGHPLIRLLGRVEVLGVRPLASASHTEKCTELATYIVLNPGSTKSALVDAVWSGRRVKDTYVNQTMSRLRGWFGINPITGQEYLPKLTRRFDREVTTDWAVFCDLVGPDPTAASTEALEDALCLVECEPISVEKGYAFEEFVRHDIISGVVDAAYELARRRYMAGQWRQADAAAAVGVHVFVGHDQLWRLRLLAAHAGGSQSDVLQLIRRIEARFTELGFDLEPETADLLEALRRHDLEAITAAREAL